MTEQEQLKLRLYCCFMEGDIRCPDDGLIFEVVDTRDPNPYSNYTHVCPKHIVEMLDTTFGPPGSFLAVFEVFLAQEQPVCEDCIPGCCDGRPHDYHSIACFIGDPNFRTDITEGDRS